MTNFEKGKKSYDLAIEEMEPGRNDDAYEDFSSAYELFIMDSGRHPDDENCLRSIQQELKTLCR